MSFVDNTGAHAEVGHSFAEILRNLLLFEFAKIEKHLKRQGWIGSKTLCLDVAEWLGSSRSIRRLGGGVRGSGGCRQCDRNGKIRRGGDFGNVRRRNMLGDACTGECGWRRLLIRLLGLRLENGLLGRNASCGFLAGGFFVLSLRHAVRFSHRLRSLMNLGTRRYRQVQCGGLWNWNDAGLRCWRSDRVDYLSRLCGLRFRFRLRGQPFSETDEGLAELLAGRVGKHKDGGGQYRNEKAG